LFADIMDAGHYFNPGNQTNGTFFIAGELTIRIARAVKGIDNNIAIKNRNHRFFFFGLTRPSRSSMT